MICSLTKSSVCYAILTFHCYVHSERPLVSVLSLTISLIIKSPHFINDLQLFFKMASSFNVFRPTFLLLLLFTSNQIEGIQSIYNPICCLVILSWKGDHPTMSPQSCRSAVQRLFSLRLLIGCVSVSNSGLGWNSNLLRCLLILSLMTSLT